jgi:FkbM family methyltransferase
MKELANKTISSLKYLVNRFILRRQYLTAKDNKYGIRFKFKTEDVVGRHIYKSGEYEKSLSEFVAKYLSFQEGDVALDVGANIGWYSLLLDKLMPDNSLIYAFEPDPLNYGLLCSNIKLNNASKVVPVNFALSDKNEVRKLYQYSNNNLGRHSLLDINEGNYVEVETITLDSYIDSVGIDVARVKFIKIDIEGYEYFALCGANNLLDQVTTVISEFVPRYMEKGGVEPERFLDLLIEKGFDSYVIRDGDLVSQDKAALLMKKACDIVWLKR